MRQELVDELSKASVEDIVSVVSFDWDDEKKNQLVIGLINDLAESMEHDGQLVLEM